MITGIRGLLHFPFTPCRKNIHDPPAGYLSNVITARKRRLCLHRCLSVHGGSVRGRGHAWGRWGMCGGGVHGGGMRGGGHAWQGACVARGWGSAWQRGHAWQGGGRACHSRYYGIRSMSGRYASYWNAFLFKHFNRSNYHWCRYHWWDPWVPFPLGSDPKTSARGPVLSLKHGKKIFCLGK